MRCHLRIFEIAKFISSISVSKIPRFPDRNHMPADLRHQILRPGFSVRSPDPVSTTGASSFFVSGSTEFQSESDEGPELCSISAAPRYGYACVFEFEKSEPTSNFLTSLAERQQSDSWKVVIGTWHIPLFECKRQRKLGLT